MHQGIGMFSNDLFGTNIPEENILRTAARKVGRAIGGERGEKVGAAAYDTANFLATAYSIGGGVKEVLSLTSKTLGAEAKITKLAAPYSGHQSLLICIKLNELCRRWWSVNRFPKHG